MEFIKKHRLSIEHFLLFVLFPFSLALNFLIYIKLGLGLIALIYVVTISFKKSYFKSLKLKFNPTQKSAYFKRLGIKFLIIALLTSLITFIFYRESLFNPIQNNLPQYFIILGVYAFLSVVPQEFIYRKFYFQRYKTLFKSEKQLIVINTLVFCLGHLFFNNLLVLAITLIGGLIFSLSYLKYQSFKWICIEHSLYGLWLYTIGLGGLLGFPVN
ncbi:CPBP family intramembrane glutamic endopeptidase [Flavobacteriaceae bacterium 14752]|uniref:CPBP family intramembrane glutamic endopeptidase n=1 Tax=Mesohalobacter salilacus TaxID=2491711 RepID=UPI000F641285|nr:CPBP family intramembrane metalloprotease [Flavobacteriaceae bacterium 14752]